MRNLAISTIVPTFNQARILDVCIGALAAQTIPAEYHEIVVVNDCSTDDTCAVVEAWQKRLPNLVFITQPKNRGQACARNLGIDKARGDLVVFIDADLIVCPAYLQEHWTRQQTEGGHDVACLGNVEYAPECMAGSNFARFINSRYLGQRSPREMGNLDLNNLPPVFFGGGIASARKEHLVKAGKFDDSIRLYGGEDIDLGFRLHRLGVRFAFLEKARLVHHDVISMDRIKAKAIESGRESLPIVFRKHPELFSFSAYHYLMPVAPDVDGMKVRFMKRVYGGLLNRPMVHVAEKILRAVDNRQKWACPMGFKYLLAGWTRMGLKAASTGVSKVYNR